MVYDPSYNTPPDRLLEEKTKAYLMHTRKIKIHGTPDDVPMDWVLYLRGKFWGIGAFDIQRLSFKEKEVMDKGVALSLEEYNRLAQSQRRLFQKEGRCHLLYFVLALDGLYSADLGVKITELPDITVKGKELRIATRYFKRLDLAPHYSFTLKALDPQEVELTEKEKAAADQRTIGLLEETKKGLRDVTEG